MVFSPEFLNQSSKVNFYVGFVIIFSKGNIWGSIGKVQASIYI